MQLYSKPRMEKFTLKILWLKHNIAFSIEHIVKQGYSPLTPYFFWPRSDAWTQVRKELESKPWISNNEKIDVLNKVTAIINYWQEKKQEKNLDQVQKEFPRLIFYGDQ